MTNKQTNTTWGFSDHLETLLTYVHVLRPSLAEDLENEIRKEIERARQEERELVKSRVKDIRPVRIGWDNFDNLKGKSAGFILAVGEAGLRLAILNMIDDLSELESKPEAGFSGYGKDLDHMED